VRSHGGTDPRRSENTPRSKTAPQAAPLIQCRASTVTLRPIGSCSVSQAKCAGLRRQLTRTRRRVRRCRLQGSAGRACGGPSMTSDAPDADHPATVEHDHRGVPPTPAAGGASETFDLDVGKVDRPATAPCFGARPCRRPALPIARLARPALPHEILGSARGVRGSQMALSVKGWLSCEPGRSVEALLDGSSRQGGHLGGRGSPEIGTNRTPWSLAVETAVSAGLSADPRDRSGLRRPGSVG
jgi:hypothetical protein